MASGSCPGPVTTRKSVDHFQVMLMNKISDQKAIFGKTEKKLEKYCILHRLLSFRVFQKRKIRRSENAFTPIFYRCKCDFFAAEKSAGKDAMRVFHCILQAQLRSRKIEKLKFRVEKQMCQNPRACASKSPVACRRDATKNRKQPN